MKYLSVCSGIEAATVAWHGLGWTPVGFSEIDPFPSAVLAHHFPEVPNLGDMTKYKEWPYERGSIDLLVGGTPCQAFSVAGLRKGLSDPRGNLALVYLGIADHFRPRWIVWENVPGVLSSNGGRDFGSFLGALAELRYGFSWRILDAQYSGVPQRRRRVFVVGYLGDWRPAAAVLFERESLRRDTPPSREPGKIVAAITANGVGTCGADGNQAQAGHIVAMTQYGEVAGTLAARHDSSPCADRGQNIVYGIPGNWIGRKPENGGNATEPMNDVAPCLTKTDRHAVCTAPIIMAHGQANAEVREDGQATTLTCNHEAPILIKKDVDSLETFSNKGIISKHGEDDASPQKTNTRKVLRLLREEIGEKAFAEWGFGILNSFFSSEILQQALYGLGLRCPTLEEFGLVNYSLSRKEDSAERLVRYLRERKCIGCSSFRWEPHEQRTKELAAYLSQLSYPGTSAEKIMLDLWEACEGEGILRKALSEVQKIRESVYGQKKSTHGSTVRRLVPTECEFLQGFPRDWTRIPWRGKPAEQCPDGPRYKAIGNSMAVPVMKWIGCRIKNITGGLYGVQG